MAENKTPVKLDKKIVDEKIEEGHYLARAIVEIIGKPKKHVDETLNNLILDMSQNEKYKLVDYSIENAEKVEESEGLFSAFAEVEMLCKDAVELMNFVIDYMPASVEVLQPANLNVPATYLSDILTELVGRMHMIDGEFKKVVAKNKIMSDSLSIMIQNSILIFLNLGPKTAEKIAEVVGVKQEQTKVFLDKLTKEAKIQFNEETKKYSLVPKKS